MPQKIAVSGDNITLDLLLVRVHGMRGQELFEKALEMNPGLAGEGVFLRQGREVVIPDLPNQTEYQSTTAIDLFG